MKVLAATLLLVACGARDASPNRYAGPRYQDRYSVSDVTKHDHRERGGFFNLEHVKEAATVIMDAIDVVTGRDAIMNSRESQGTNFDDGIVLREMRQILEDLVDTVVGSEPKSDVRGEAEDDRNVFDKPESSSYDDTEPIAPARDSDYKEESAWREGLSKAGKTLGKKLLEEGAARAFNEGRQNLGKYLRDDERHRSNSPPRSSSSSYSYGSPRYQDPRQSSSSQNPPLYKSAEKYHNWSKYKL